jgi:hypothetical protein
MFTSGRTEPSSVAGTTALIGPSADPIPRRSRADLPCCTRPDMWFAVIPVELELVKAFCADCPAWVLPGRSIAQAGVLGLWGGERWPRPLARLAVGGLGVGFVIRPGGARSTGARARLHRHHASCPRPFHR